MALFGDLAETGNCPAQFQVNDLAKPRAELSPMLLFFIPSRKNRRPEACARRAGKFVPPT